MRGSEGGIPYSTPKQKMTVHARKHGISYLPLCGATPAHYQTHHDIAKVTCYACKQVAS